MKKEKKEKNRKKSGNFALTQWTGIWAYSMFICGSVWCWFCGALPQVKVWETEANFFYVHTHTSSISVFTCTDLPRPFSLCFSLCLLCRFSHQQHVFVNHPKNTTQILFLQQRLNWVCRSHAVNVLTNLTTHVILNDIVYHILANKKPTWNKREGNIISAFTGGT